MSERDEVWERDKVGRVGKRIGARAWVAWKSGACAEGDDHCEKSWWNAGCGDRWEEEWVRGPVVAMWMEQRVGIRKAVGAWME